MDNKKTKKEAVLDSPLEMPPSCKSVMDHMERELQKEADESPKNRSKNKTK